MKLERKTTLVEKDVNAGKRLQKIDSIVADLTEWLEKNTFRIEVKPGNNGFYVLPDRKKLFEFKVVYNEDQTLNFSAMFDTQVIFEKKNFAYDDFESAIAEALEECHKHFITGNEKVLKEFKDPEVLGKTGLFKKLSNAINKKAANKQNEKDVKATAEVIKDDLESALKQDLYLQNTTLNTTINKREINCVAEFAYIIAVSFSQAGTDVTDVIVNKIFNVLYPSGKAVKIKNIESFIQLLKETLKTKPDLNSLKAPAEEEKPKDKKPEETTTEEKPEETATEQPAETTETETQATETEAPATEEPKPEEAPQEEATVEEQPAEETNTADVAKEKFKKLRKDFRKDPTKVDYKEFIKAFADIDLKSDKNRKMIIDAIMSMYPTKKK